MCLFLKHTFLQLGTKSKLSESIMILLKVLYDIQVLQNLKMNVVKIETTLTYKLVYKKLILGGFTIGTINSGKNTNVVSEKGTNIFFFLVI